MARRLLRFVGGRILATAGLLIALSFVVFTLQQLAPGDIARNLLGNRAVSPEALEAVRRQYNLDQPFLVQYWRWFTDAVTGDLGTSIRTGDTVVSMLGQRIGLTLALTIGAFVLALVTGIPLGIAAARRAGTTRDRAIVGTSVVGVSAPSFAVGLLLLYVFAVMLGWFPVYGTGDGFVDRVWHLVLPCIALAAGLGALVVKMTRTSVIAELDADYVTFAKARGVSRRAITRLYLTNAAIPIVTSAGLMLAFLFGGTILVETTFSLPGLGQLLADSITYKDIPVVQAVTLIVALVIAIVGFVVDLSYLVIDPRVRRQAVQS